MFISLIDVFLFLYRITMSLGFMFPLRYAVITDGAFSFNIQCKHVGHTQEQREQLANDEHLYATLGEVSDLKHDYYHCY